MRLFEINNDDEFNLESVSLVQNSQGVRCLHVNYGKTFAEFSITLEAYTEKPEARVVEKLTYLQFKKRFPKHRIYVQGFVKVDRCKTLKPTSLE